MPNIIVFVIFLSSFAMFAPMACVPPMELILKTELNLTYAQTSILFAAPMLSLAGLAIPGGLIADRLGSIKAGGIGIIILATGAALRSLASEPNTLMMSTFIYGIGFGLLFPTLPKLVGALGVCLSKLWPAVKKHGQSVIIWPKD